MDEINKLKASVRSVLLSCGKTATESEFRKAFFELEGRSFNEVLKQFNTNFLNLFSRIPDVAKVVYVRNMIFIQRVSSEASSHLDHLTINKYGKNYKGPKLVTKSGAIKGRPATNPLNIQALPYPVVPSRQVPIYPQRTYNQMPIFPQKNAHINVTFNYNDNQRGVNFYQTPLRSTNVSVRPQQQSTSSDISFYQSRPVTTSSQHSIASTKNEQIFNDKNSMNVKTEPVKQPELRTPMKIQPTASTKPANVGFMNNKIFNEAVQQALSNDEKEPKSVASNSTKTTEPSKFIFSSPIQSVKEKLSKLGINRDILAPRPLNRESVEETLANSSKVTENDIIGKLQKLKMNDVPTNSKAVAEESKENLEVACAQIKSPVAIRDRIRSMRIFREALQQVNEKDQKKTDDKLLIETDKLVQLPLPIQNEEEPVFEIKVLDVLTPSQFTFQFNFQKLKELTEKLNEFYRNLKDVEIEKYRVKQLVNENIVAVCRQCCWYRAQIKSFNDTQVEIHFVDSMKISTETVSPKNIYHLHQKFTTESPKSAIGKMYGLKPKNSADWSDLSSSKLIDIQDKVVLASVKSVEDDVYALAIFGNENQGERIFDVLIGADLAEADSNDLEIEVVNRSLV